MKQKIFISYRRDTSFELAKSICRELEKRRHSCFFDVKSIKAGDFYQIILSKMDECDIFLLLVSDSTFDRCSDPADYVRLEIEAALERGLTIIPIMVEKAEIPADLPPSLSPIRKAHQLRYIREYSDEIYPMIFQAIDSVRGKKKKPLAPALAILAVVILAAAFLLFGPLRPGKNHEETPATGIAAETEAPAAGTAAETEVPTESAYILDGPSETAPAQGGQAETGSSAASAQGGQILPDDFLLHMEELAQEKIQTLTTDTSYITVHTDDGNFDIDSRYVSISGETLSKNAVFTETGGTTTFYLCYEADVQIDESWSGFQGPQTIEPSLEDAAIVFTLDTFPNKFLDQDGNLNYSDQDFQFSKIYTSLDDFQVLLHQDLQYVEHDYYKITLP